MKVVELIDKLKKFDPDKEVLFVDNICCLKKVQVLCVDEINNSEHPFYKDHFVYLVNESHKNQKVDEK